MTFPCTHTATVAIRAFEAAHGTGYVYRFTTTTSGRLQVLIYGETSDALLGVL